MEVDAYRPLQSEVGRPIKSHVEHQDFEGVRKQSKYIVLITYVEVLVNALRTTSFFCLEDGKKKKRNTELTSFLLPEDATEVEKKNYYEMFVKDGQCSVHAACKER